MATVGWSASGVIHYNFLCPGETTTAENTGQSKRPILLHDNVRPHVSQMTLQKLNELAYETLPKRRISATKQQLKTPSKNSQEKARSPQRD
uniref:Histone-lysine N-methyltransferase SETMAR n=1 Tax=Heterorhabditis bacteriophora TaxID=37862 RepID=A0A1I7XI76_HETBA